MKNYVNITRHFRDPDADPTTAAALGMRRAMGLPPGVRDWSSLLPAGSTLPVVLVAATRTGKSTELRHQAAQLRQSSRYAVYASAPAIVDDFEAGLEREERDEYVRWQNSAEPLELFVDAVDELHLRSRTLFDLLNQLGRKLDMATRRVRLILSARPGAWTPGSTQKLKDVARLDEDAQPLVVTFEPLDDLALEQLALAAGVVDPNAFVSAIGAEGLQSLWEIRPEDVRYLAGMWQAGERFDRWSQLLKSLVDQSSYEAEPERARKRMLSSQAMHQGLQRIAAAMLLTKLPQVTVPTVPGIATAVSSRRLFDDWSTGAVLELFECHLLVHKGKDAEAAQLPVGPLYYSLAAQWLATRVHRGANVEFIRDALLVRVFDEIHYRVPSLHQPIIGWLASELPAFRKLLLQDHPFVALYEGDPDALTDDEIRISLRALCSRLAAGQPDLGWPTQATVRKLARAAIEADVCALLVSYQSVHPVERRLEPVFEHLLRLAIVGRYKSCVSVAVALMTDAGKPAAVRKQALKLVSRTGSAADRLSLRALVSDPEVEIRDALLESLVAEGFSGKELVEFLCRGGDLSFRIQLRRCVDEIALADIDAALMRLTGVLTGPTIDADSENALGLAPELLDSRVRRGSDDPPLVINALIAVERRVAAEAGHSRSGTFASVGHNVQSRRDLRRALWDARIDADARDPVAFTLLSNPPFGGPVLEDLEWLHHRLASKPVAWRFLIDSFWQRTTDDERVQLRSHSSPDLRAYVSELEEQQERTERDQRVRDVQRKRKQGRDRRANIRLLESRRDAIASGDDIGSLISAWSLVADSAVSKRGELDLNRLRIRVGNDLVEVFQRGFVACWRKQSAVLPEAGSNKTLIRYAVGLTGIDIEARAGLDFSTLSPADAENAAHYACYELNGFPVWMDDLLLAHPETVRGVLLRAVAADWKHPGKTFGVLRFATHSSNEVAAVLRDITLNLLTGSAPSNLETTHDAVGALLKVPVVTPELAALAAREIGRASATHEELPEWLRLGAHIAPQETAGWVANKQAKNELPDSVVLRLAELLEIDLDERAGRTSSTALMSPSSLGLWIKLILRIVRPEDDAQHEGMHVYGTREHAQAFRDRCLKRLADMPTAEAHAVLESLISNEALRQHRAMFLRITERQAATAADAAAPKWTEEDILRLERGDEKLPRSLDELAAMVVRHLRDVGRLVENDNFSYRSLFIPETHEREIQLWVASCLRVRARGLYSVDRENVVDNSKEVDISALAAGGWQVPIEIKPLLAKYSPEKLVAVVRDQLLGQYMLPPDRQFGVLLLARHQERRWTIDRKRIDDINHLRSWLQAKATALAADQGKTVQVVVIDMLPPTARNGTAKSPVSPIGTKKAKPLKGLTNKHSRGSSKRKNTKRAPKKKAAKRTSKTRATKQTTRNKVVPKDRKSTTRQLVERKRRQTRKR